jgi:VCBS repeat-containing protein
MKSITMKGVRILLIMALLVGRWPGVILSVQANPNQPNLVVTDISSMTVEQQITYQWDLDISVSPTSLNLPLGTSEDVNYEITATRTEVTEGFKATFTVTVRNSSNQDATFDLVYLVQKPNGTNLFSGTLANGVQVPNNSTLAETFTVLIPNHSDISPSKMRVDIVNHGSSFIVSGRETSARHFNNTTSNSFNYTDQSITISSEFETDVLVTETTTFGPFLKTIDSEDAPGVRTITSTVTGQTSSGEISDSVDLEVTTYVDAPIARDDAFSVDEDETLTVDAPGVLANDLGPDGSSLVVALDTDVSNGTLVLNEDGSFEYTPDPDFFGEDSFTYTLSDGTDSDTATVTITVNPVNDAPVALESNLTVDQGLSVSGTLNATDVDNELVDLIFELETAPVNGVVDIDENGDFTYTHDGSLTSSDSFTFLVRDPDGLTSSAVVTITVILPPPVVVPPPAINLPPIANALSITLAAGASVTSALTGSDPEGAPLSFGLISGPTNGTVSVNLSGTFTYTHNGGSSTSDSFVFSVSDGDLTDTATVTITITQPTPVAEETIEEVEEVEEVEELVEDEPEEVVVVDEPQTPLADASGFNFNWLWWLLLVPFFFFLIWYKKRKDEEEEQPTA